MPKYSYFCESCKNGFEITHSIKERLEKCEICGDIAIRKLPCIPTYLTKKKEENPRKVGSVVEEYIEKNKEQLKNEKKKLKEVEYK
jgi:putative FmdB family regulatory protein